MKYFTALFVLALPLFACGQSDVAALASTFSFDDLVKDVPVCNEVIRNSAMYGPHDDKTQNSLDQCVKQTETRIEGMSRETAKYTAKVAAYMKDPKNKGKEGEIASMKLLAFAAGTHMQVVHLEVSLLFEALQYDRERDYADKCASAK
jgi:hypothetical protein